MSRHACPGALGALAALLVPVAAGAATDLPGGTTGNATWTAAGSPYVLHGDVTVQAGAVLTIEAGAEIQVAPTDAQGSGRDPALVELAVQGQLVVAGTAGSPVRFHALSSTAPGAWTGIVVGAGASATIVRAVVEHAVVALENAAGGAASR